MEDSKVVYHLPRIHGNSTFAPTEISGFFFLNGKRPGLPFQNFRLSREFFAPCKGIQDTLGFWIPRRGFRIPFTGFQIFLGGTWIPDSNCYWDSGFLHLYSGFQGPGFRIPQAKISKIPNSKCKNFPDSGIRIPLHGATFL